MKFTNSTLMAAVKAAGFLPVQLEGHIEVHGGTRLVLVKVDGNSVHFRETTMPSALKMEGTDDAIKMYVNVLLSAVRPKSSVHYPEFEYQG